MSGESKIGLHIQKTQVLENGQARGKARRSLSTKELAAELRISDRQVFTWVKLGCPHGKARGPAKGRRGHRFDPLEVKAWLISRGIAPRDGTPPNPPREIPDAPDEPGYDAMVSRVHAAERGTFATWAQAVRDGKNASEIAALSRLWLEQVDALRKVEKDQAGIREHAEDWLDRKEAEDAYRRLAEEIKTALLSFPRSHAPRCEGLSAAQIEAILTEGIYAVFRLLSDPICNKNPR